MERDRRLLLLLLLLLEEDPILSPLSMLERMPEDAPVLRCEPLSHAKRDSDWPACRMAPRLLRPFPEKPSMWKNLSGLGELR